jgi:hypothetical protein
MLKKSNGRWTSSKWLVYAAQAIFQPVGLLGFLSGQFGHELPMTGVPTDGGGDLFSSHRLHRDGRIKELLQFHGGASFFQLSLHLFSFFFVDFLFNRTEVFNQFLGIHQGSASDCFDFFNDVQFLVAKSS